MSAANEGGLPGKEFSKAVTPGSDGGTSERVPESYADGRTIGLTQFDEETLKRLRALHALRRRIRDRAERERDLGRERTLER